MVVPCGWSALGISDEEPSFLANLRGTTVKDTCDKKKQIEDISKLSTEERETKIKEQESQMEKAEKEFKEFVEGLHKSYQEASDKKDKDVETIKAGGLGLLKSVHAFEKKQKSEL